MPGGFDGDYHQGVTLNQSTSPLPLGAAAFFDGTASTYADLGLFHPGNSVTVEAWVRLNPDARANSYHAIVARWDGSYELDIATDDRPNLVVRNQANTFGLVAAPSPIVRGQWHHLVGTYHNGVMSIYVNGVLGAAAPLAGTLRNGGPSPDRVLIGGTRDGAINSFNWRGLIDEVAIYNEALPEHRILAHYRAGLPETRLQINAQGELRWPAFPPTLVLQFSESLGDTATWDTDQSPRVIENGFFKVELPLNGTQKFYRLLIP